MDWVGSVEETVEAGLASSSPWGRVVMVSCWQARPALRCWSAFWPPTVCVMLTTTTVQIRLSTRAQKLSSRRKNYSSASLTSALRSRPSANPTCAGTPNPRLSTCRPLRLRPDDLRLTTPKYQAPFPPALLSASSSLLSIFYHPPTHNGFPRRAALVEAGALHGRSRHRRWWSPLRLMETSRDSRS